MPQLLLFYTKNTLSAALYILGKQSASLPQITSKVKFKGENYGFIQ